MPPDFIDNFINDNSALYRVYCTYQIACTLLKMFWQSFLESSFAINIFFYVWKIVFSPSQGRRVWFGWSIWTIMHAHQSLSLHESYMYWRLLQLTYHILDNNRENTGDCQHHLWYVTLRIYIWVFTWLNPDIPPLIVDIIFNMIVSFKVSEVNTWYLSVVDQ